MGWKRDAFNSWLILATMCGMVMESSSLGYAQYSSGPGAEMRAIVELEGRTTGESATTIIPSLRLAERYDSNVFFVRGGKLEDFVTTISPQVEVAHKSQWVEGTIRGGGTGEIYAKNPGLNYVGADATLALNLDRAVSSLVRGMGLHISDDIRYTPQPPAFAAPTSGSQVSEAFVQGIQARRANSFTNIARVEASYFFSPYMGISSTYGDSRIRFGRGISTPGEGIVPSGEFINTNFQTLTSGLVLKPSMNDTISLSHQYRKSTFSIPDREESGFSTQGAIASWTRFLTPALKVMGEGGFSVLTGGGTVHPVAGASVEWQGQYTTVRVSYSRAIAPSFLFASTALLSQSVTGMVTRRLAESLSVSMSASYAVNNSVPDSSLVRFESYFVTSSLHYKISRIFTGTLSYTHNEFQRTSLGQSFDFNRDMVMFQLSAEWR